jgi:hypothetical protein
MTRIFTGDDQNRFAELSGDFNPIHVDPIAARRLLFGRTVVHGIHALLWAVDQWLAGLDAVRRVRLTKLKAQFNRPLLVGDPVDLSVSVRGPDAVRFDITSTGGRCMTFSAAFEDFAGPGPAVRIAAGNPPRGVCRNRSADELRTARGAIDLHADPQLAGSLFPAVVKKLPPGQLALLLASTRLVGMEAPGLDSIYAGLELETAAQPPSAPFTYEVESLDERFSMLAIRITGGGFDGRISAALRPSPKNQSTFAELRGLVRADEFAGINALVIGGSRGLGEVAAKALAAGGAEVRFTYSRGRDDAGRVAADITSGGGSAKCFGYDVQLDSARLAELLGGWKPSLLGFFATPTIAAAGKKGFSSDRFHELCRFYIDGFSGTFEACLTGGMPLAGVLYPSSAFVDDLPAGMGEYATAKSAAETLCRFLAKTHRNIRFECPRWTRLATDQTASLIPADIRNPDQAVLDALRQVTENFSRGTQ